MAAMSSPGILDAIGRRISRLGGPPMTSESIGSPGRAVGGGPGPVGPFQTPGPFAASAPSATPINTQPSPFVMEQAGTAGPLAAGGASSLQPPTMGAIKRRGARAQGGLGY